jgi:hypothetical protein
VVIPDTQASIKEYKKQKHYNQWEFVYFPLEDQLQAAGGAIGVGQQNLNGANSSSGTGFGSSSGFGSTSGTNSITNGSQSNGSGTTGSGSSTPPQQ